MDTKRQYIDCDEFTFCQLLNNAPQNEDIIIDVLSHRFEEIQKRQKRVYSLIIHDKGTSTPIQMNNGSYGIIRIPIVHQSSVL